MPIYEYYCQDCKIHFDLQRYIKEMNSPCKCLNCGSLNVERVFLTSAYINLKRSKEKHIKTRKPPNLIIKNCEIKNFGTGIKVNNGRIIGDSIHMHNVQNAIDAENSEVDITNLDAKIR